MDMNENHSLQVLEQLFEEFFSPDTNNLRKHEIEQQLNMFKCVPHLGRLCLYFVTRTSSQYVTMFSLSVLENIINAQWHTIDWAYKEELKSILYNYLIENGYQAPHFLRAKYAKLVVDIAKQDWPHRYPNYLDNILELLRIDSNQLIGLILLKTTSEEFMGSDSSLSKERQEEISRLLYPYIPSIFEILTSILDNLGSKPRHTATATPPPSPTHPTTLPSLSEQLASASFKLDSKILTKEVLNTLQHLFSWVPINQIPPQIIKCIFNFTNVSSYAQDDDDMCVLAMSTINELLYRKCTPPGSQAFFYQLYHHTIDLLRDLASSSLYRIETLDPTFVEKLTELLVLLIQQHFWRLETEPNFSAIEFLSLLFHLTVQLPSIQCYTRCLAAWVAFVKQIKPQNAHKYSNAFMGVIEMILKKIQFTVNFSQLKHINNNDVDDDNETEWTSFIKISNEVIAMMAEFAPSETFNQVLIPWKNHYETFKHLSNGNIDLSRVLNCDNSETDRLSFVLNDFSTLTQTLARLSFLFTDQDIIESTGAYEETGFCLFEKVLECASIATNSKFYNLALPPKFHSSFINVHSELLAALKTWFVWTMQKNKLNDNYLSTLIEVTIPVLLDGAQVPVGISCSAAHLLLTISGQISPPTLMRSPQVQDFVRIAPSLKYENIEIHHLVNGTVCNLLLRSWGELVQEDNLSRLYLINLYFECLTKDFRSLTPTSDEQRVSSIANLVLPCLSHIIDFCKQFPQASKKMLQMAIKGTIDHALKLFPAYIKYCDVSQNILTLFINILAVLQKQLGPDGTSQAVNIFLQVAISEQQVSSASNIEKLLQILKLVVEAPGSSNKNFLPAILTMCLQHICPLVLSQVDEYPEVFISLLNLFYSILLHRWQYFYISQVKAGFSPCVPEGEIVCDSSEKPQELLAILQVFGQALLQHDINIFKLSMGSLEDLHSKWNLYQKNIFREELLHKFVAVLLEALVEKSQALLSEDIQVAVYNMASTNFEHFFNKCLPDFLRTLDVLSPEQCEMLLRNFLQNYDKDMPTFIQHLRVFVKDAQHYKLCNSRQHTSLIN